MNWINPIRKERVIKRCEFCGSDISTPYKGVHDETEIINGMPSKCRNNGRMNMHIQFGYMSDDKPKENIKYFVEHPDTNLWWTGYQWTNDPNAAFACELKGTADRYARFQRIERYIITEHEFVKTITV
jgi:hypothetical protein